MAGKVVANFPSSIEMVAPALEQSVTRTWFARLTRSATEIAQPSAKTKR